MREKLNHVYVHAITKWNALGKMAGALADSDGRKL
jgi:hypothetical protein